jgi:uncharacterized protein YodC (DUF2158 family)
MQFRVGEVVQLKSLGPRMTIDEINSEKPDEAHCVWFDGKKQEGAWFNMAVLQRAPQ